VKDFGSMLDRMGWKSLGIVTKTLEKCIKKND